jgi:uncharacterized protein YbjT (DUF2867 family)
MKALIFGATGLVGNALAHLLIKDARYQKITLLNRKNLELQHEHLSQHEIDFSSLDLYKNEFNVDHLFCCLGTTIKKAKTEDAFRKIDHDLVVQLAKLSKENGAGHFVFVSAIGAHAHSKIFYNRVKGEAEQSVLRIGPQKISWVRPSLLLGERQETRPGEKIEEFFMKPFSFLMKGSFKKYAPIQAETVAQKMIDLVNGEDQGKEDFPWSKTISSI